ncbi:hypothetical protein [Rhizobium azibense]|nr:hypothetical protein [Rhizobium azibense]
MDKSFWWRLQIAAKLLRIDCDLYLQVSKFLLNGKANKVQIGGDA